jgi:hypothetical protein
MKTLILSALALFVGGAVAVSAPPQQNTAKITGDYVEARTASVFAGACHYNGELVTTGNDAVLAWNFTGGSWNGVALSGVRAVAAVSSDANLGQHHARKTELVIDSAASDAQAAALTSFLREKDGTRLGEITTVHRTAVSFKQADKQYTVKADGFASISVRPMPNNECCAQPHLVWYQPLMSLESRKVGYTERAEYSAGTVGDRWEREGENSAFYGTFSF